MAAALPSFAPAAKLGSFKPFARPDFGLSSPSCNRISFCAPRAASDGPLKRPSVPTAPIPPNPIPPTVAPPAVDPKPSTSSPSLSSGVTVEYQRQKAKEMIAYFEDKKYEEQVLQGRIFGWIQKNEIGNGRWAMFGLAVGLLTELATGVNFPDQLKIIAANLGIVDFDF